MPEYNLEPAFALGGYHQSFEGVDLCEVTDIAIVSIAIPRNAEPSVGTTIIDVFGIILPSAGKSVVARDMQICFVGLGPDTFFAISQHLTAEAVKTVSAKLENTAYTTDQTDGWVALEISGVMACTALERICPIDLHPTQFEVNDIARTSMEHLGALIIRTDADKYLILSASSSARSFLHAIETSIKNVS